jgi:predicted RNA binding protein YcfA (HicA-like mRNA interferase family)
MSRWTPCKKNDFIRRLRKLGFDGPYSGARHQFMVYQQHRLTVPSNSEYSISQLRMMIRELEAILGRSVSADEWNGLS